MRGYHLITGCSGGGKSTLLAELARRGHSIVEEPGRRIVAEEWVSGGDALPWVDLAAFARRAVAVARADLATAEQARRPVFFDRGLFDAAVALQTAAGQLVRSTLGDWPYDEPVFLAPPWPELFATDAARRHNLASAVAEFQRLEAALGDLGLDICVLPKVGVAARADLVLSKARG